MDNARASFQTSRKDTTRTVTGQFQWPVESVLYQLSTERELLPAKAQRLMFQTYLKMNGLGFSDKIASNADLMSPSGRSPFIVLTFGPSPIIFDDFFKFADFLQAQGCGLGRELDQKEKADCEAFISLVRTSILPALEYETWINTSNWKLIKSRYGAGLPHPLYYLVPRFQWARYCWHHWDQYWEKKEDVVQKFEDACQALAVRLDESKTFFSSGLTTLDAVVYGSIEAVASSTASENLSLSLEKFPSLQQYCHQLLLTQRKGLQVISCSSTSNLLSLK